MKQFNFDSAAPIGTNLRLRCSCVGLKYPYACRRVAKCYWRIEFATLNYHIFDVLCCQCCIHEGVIMVFIKQQIFHVIELWHTPIISVSKLLADMEWLADSWHWVAYRSSYNSFAANQSLHGYAFKLICCFTNYLRVLTLGSAF